MNAFACDPDPRLAAGALADRHVVKMTLETAQVLCCVAGALGHDVSHLYRPTHRHHPVTVAAVDDPGYRAWLYLHGRALAAEYTRRYGKTHNSAAVIEAAGELLGLTDATDPQPAAWPLAMPDEFRGADPHESYRRYLGAKYAAWGDRARWTRAVRPAWA